MRILGIDYGDARTGLSISDPSGFLAGSPSVIHEWNYAKLVDKLVAFIQENKIEEIVLGHPKNMDGTVGPRAESARLWRRSWRSAPDCTLCCGTSAARRSPHTKSCTAAAKRKKSTAKASMPLQQRLSCRAIWILSAASDFRFIYLYSIFRHLFPAGAVCFSNNFFR